MRGLIGVSCILAAAAMATVPHNTLAQEQTPGAVFALASPSIVVVLGRNTIGMPARQGSGVVIEPEVVATNCHVLDKYRNPVVRYRGDVWLATLLYSDVARDLCTLKVPGLHAPPATLGEAKTMRVGDRVYTIGAPRGLELTLSDGLISSLRGAPDEPVLQITAPISPGSSGGGLFDDHARLIGLTTLYLERSQQLNFALPVEWLTKVAKHNVQ